MNNKSPTLLISEYARIWQLLQAYDEDAIVSQKDKEKDKPVRLLYDTF